MRRGVLYGGFFLLCYLVFLLVTLPADRAYGWLKESLGGGVLYEASGSVWSGKADALVVQGKTLRSFTWQFTPGSLLRGRVAYDVTFNNSDAWAKGNLGVTLGGTLVLSALKGQFAAHELQSYLPRSPARIEGTVLLTLEAAHYVPAEKRVETVMGEVVWKNAAITVIDRATLGNFKMVLTTTETGINAVIKEDGKGPLQAEGTGLLKTDRSYQFNGVVRVTDNARNDLVQGLRFIGQPDGQGGVKLSYTGKW